MVNTLWDTRIGDVKVPFLMGGVGSSLTKTRDPLSTDDVTQGISVGTVWFNSSAKRAWINYSNAAGAAAWWFAGADYTNLGANPNFEITQFGGALVGSPFAVMFEEGNLYRNVGNPIAGNGVDTTLDILGGIVLPAGAFDVLGRGLAITAQGKFGATVTGNVAISLYVNPTMSGQTVTNGVISGGTVTGGGVVIGTQALTAGAGVITASGGWQLASQFFKYGAAASNTQFSQASFVNSFASTVTHTGMQAPVFSTQTESAAMNIVLAASSSNSTANETILNFFEINAMN
jgi:hypothetical protein